MEKQKMEKEKKEMAMGKIKTEKVGILDCDCRLQQTYTMQHVIDKHVTASQTSKNWHYVLYS